MAVRCARARTAAAGCEPRPIDFNLSARQRAEAAANARAAPRARCETSGLLFGRVDNVEPAARERANHAEVLGARKTPPGLVEERGARGAFSRPFSPRPPCGPPPATRAPRPWTWTGGRRRRRRCAAGRGGSWTGPSSCQCSAISVLCRASALRSRALRSCTRCVIGEPRTSYKLLVRMWYPRRSNHNEAYYKSRAGPPSFRCYHRRFSSTSSWTGTASPQL